MSFANAAPTLVPSADDALTPPLPQRPAVFIDLDGTLIPGSANIPLAVGAFKAGLVPYRDLAVDLLRNASFIFTGATDDRAAKVRERILRAVKGFPAKQLEEIADSFVGKLAATIRPEMKAVIDEHRAQGHALILISASPTEIVARFAAAAGMDLGVGTEGERDEEGRYTGRLAGPFCYREGKVDVIAQLASQRGYDLSKSYAYTDSASDMPMLEVVGNPIVVNPEQGLRAVATTRGWRILDFGRARRVSLPVPPVKKLVLSARRLLP